MSTSSGNEGEGGGGVERWGKGREGTGGGWEGDGEGGGRGEWRKGRISIVHVESGGGTRSGRRSKEQRGLDWESHQSEFTPGPGTRRHDRTKPFELLSCIPNYKHPILCMYPSYPCNHPTNDKTPVCPLTQSQSPSSHIGPTAIRERNTHPKNRLSAKMASENPLRSPNCPSEPERPICCSRPHPSRPSRAAGAPTL